MASFLDYAFTAPLPHPGEILREAYLAPRNMTAGALAKAMGMGADGRIERIISERQAITADTALRLERVFGASAQFWMNLQNQYDLSMAAMSGSAEWKAIPRLPPPSQNDGLHRQRGRSTSSGPSYVLGKPIGAPR